MRVFLKIDSFKSHNFYQKKYSDFCKKVAGKIKQNFFKKSAFFVWQNFLNGVLCGNFFNFFERLKIIFMHLQLEDDGYD